MSALSTATVLTLLSRHIGRENGVTAEQLAREISGDPVPLRTTTTVLTRQLREAVVQLRLEGHHVCATPENGYFLAASAEELDATCLFLHERAMTTLRQIAAMKRISLPDLRGQLHLPT
ncbi:MAG TPA: hypothetical protein VJ396_07040 [Acidiferrobacterales bacterium]|nr:hypothetical protein [Acidiferrobacterales bacterium]